VATLLRSEFGDERKDRVLVRSDRKATTLLPDAPTIRTRVLEAGATNRLSQRI